MLEIQNISKTFNAGTLDEKKAIDHLSLKAEDGDFISIIGANGAGKSTLFNAIAGSFFVDEGEIYLDGKQITYQKENIRARKIGRLFQDPLSGTAPDMSILENLALAGLNRGYFSHITSKDREYFQSRLKQLNMGFENRLDTPVRLLSGGQRQALTLLMATINVPDLLLLDEHTAALDPSSASRIMELSEQIISSNHITCLMITHDMNMAIRYGNRILMMDDGKIILSIDKTKEKDISVSYLMEQFEKKKGQALSTDRMLLGI